MGTTGNRIGRFHLALSHIQTEWVFFFEDSLSGETKSPCMEYNCEYYPVPINLHTMLEN